MPPLPYCLVLRVHRTTLPSAHASLQSAPEMPHCRRTWCGRAHSFLCLYPGSAVPREQRELMSLICLIYALICWKAPCSSLWYFLGSSEAVLSIKTLETVFPSSDILQKMGILMHPVTIENVPAPKVLCCLLREHIFLPPVGLGWLCGCYSSVSWLWYCSGHLASVSWLRPRFFWAPGSYTWLAFAYLIHAGSKIVHTDS